jgi:hypothetical protein
MLVWHIAASSRSLMVLDFTTIDLVLFTGLLQKNAHVSCDHWFFSHESYGN